MNSIAQQTPEFYTSEAALTEHFKQSARSMAFKGKARTQAIAWQKQARQQLAKRLGLERFATSTADPVLLETVQCSGYAREKWRIQTEHEVWMPFYLLIPESIAQPAPLVLCPHGHGIAGKWGTAGRFDISGMPPLIEKYNGDYGVQLAHAGFIVACPDARGFGERREPALQKEQHFADSSCHALTLAGAPLGFTVQGMWAWDLMRLLDFLTLDERVDKSRIGCAGLSGGGLQTLNLAALDTRIQAAVVSGYFYGVQESLQIKNLNCMCNMVPGLWEDFDMGDIGALIAPRGLFIETGDQDRLNGKSGVDNVLPQVAISRKIFQILEAEEQLIHHIFEDGHRWNGTRAIPWLKAKLQS